MCFMFMRSGVACFGAFALSSLILSACGPATIVGPRDCAFAPPIFDARGDVVHAEGPEGCVRVERQPLGNHAVCKACPYEATRLLARLTLDDGDGDDGDEGGLDVDLDVSDTEARSDGDDIGALTYEATHHNWLDVVTATKSGFSVRILYDVQGGSWNLEISTGNGDDGRELLLLPVVGSHQ